MNKFRVYDSNDPLHFVDFIDLSPRIEDYKFVEWEARGVRAHSWEMRAREKSPGLALTALRNAIRKKLDGTQDIFDPDPRFTMDDVDEYIEFPTEYLNEVPWKFYEADVVQHVKTKVRYYIVCRSIREDTHARCYTYRNLDDGGVWTREKDEMEDGRFELWK
jgi:hypothetical protein